MYIELKKQNSKTIYLFKSGIFFISLDKDAYSLSNIFNFKISNLTPSIVKCGFPCSSFEKYEKLFKACNLDIKIVETEKNTLFSLKDYSLEQNIAELLNSITSIDINNLSIQEAYSFLEKLQKDIKNLA